MAGYIVVKYQKPERQKSGLALEPVRIVERWPGDEIAESQNHGEFVVPPTADDIDPCAFCDGAHDFVSIRSSKEHDVSFFLSLSLSLSKK